MSSLFLLALAAVAAPSDLQHTGRVIDATGLPLDGSFDVIANLYDGETSTVAVWSDTFTGVTFDEGYFALSLDAIPDAVFDTDLWVDIAVDGSFLPRQRIVSVPFAIRANTATNVSGGTVDASEIRVGGNVVIDSGGVVGSGTLGSLSCGADQVALFDGASWGCGSMPADATWAALPDKPGVLSDDLVDWTEVQNVPAAFLDGVDDGITTEVDPDFAAWLATVDPSAWDAKMDVSETRDVSLSGKIGFGAATRQMIDLWNTDYGIGIQASTLYQRTATNFAWHRGGSHEDAALDPGAGGDMLMYLDGNGLHVDNAVEIDGTGFGAAEVDAWNAAAGSANSGTEILGRNDSRVSFVGTWTDSGGWGENRLSGESRYTNCSGSSSDCSGDSIVLTLDDNRHRSVSMSHLDWTNSGLVSVYMSVDGGPEGPLRNFNTLSPSRSGGADYHSTMHPVALDLPLGADVVLRIEATTGRMHFEGFALGDDPLPVTVAPRHGIHGIPSSNSWTTTDLVYAFTLEADAQVDFDYNLAGSLSPDSHILCRLYVQRPGWDWYPREGRSISGNTTYFDIDGHVSGGLAAGAYNVSVQCRSPSTVANDPGANDYHDRNLRVTIRR